MSATAAPGGQFEFTPWRTMPCELDDGPAPKAAIGLIALANDITIEPELYTFLPRDGVAVYSNRIPMSADGNINTLLEMKSSITEGASLLVPDIELDVIAYGCTSGSMAIGPSVVEEKIHAVRPGIACTNPVSAALKGLRTLDCSRIALITPYPDDINVVVERYVSEQGFDIVDKASFKQAGDPQIVRVPPQAIYAAGLELGRSPQVEAVFLSCTALRVSSIIAPLEAALGKPVVSSNQALAWDCLRLAGCDEQPEGYGQLFSH